MRKQKFVLTKHTRQNGSYYYTCKVSIETFRKPKNIFELFKYGIKEGVKTSEEMFIRSSGHAYNHLEYCFDERGHALLAIDKYIKIREEEEGEKVVSTETEIIYR
jgi:hypothetical protein